MSSNLLTFPGAAPVDELESLAARARTFRVLTDPPPEVGARLAAAESLLETAAAMLCEPDGEVA